MISILFLGVCWAAVAMYCLRSRPDKDADPTGYLADTIRFCTYLGVGSIHFAIAIALRVLEGK